MNNLQLITRPNKNMMQRYLEMDRSPPLNIYWEIDGDQFYPDDQWYDFGIVIIGWWVRDLRLLSETTASVKWSFMEGPIYLRVTHYYEKDYIELKPSNRDDIVWKTTFDQLKNTLIRAVDDILKQLKNWDIGSKEQEVLSRYLQALHQISNT